VSQLIFFEFFPFIPSNLFLRPYIAVMENKNDTKIKENLGHPEDSEIINSEENIESEQSIKEKEPTSEELLKQVEDKLLRSLAETENQRRRFERETKEAFDYGGFNFARETLSVLDNLQRAHLSLKNNESLKDNKDLDKFLENIEIIEKDLISVFEKNNIKKIKCLNEKFDANKHQAMLEIEDEHSETGMVLQEIQPGYFFKDRLLRPSFVAVSKKKSPKNDEKDKINDDSTLEEK